MQELTLGSLFDGIGGWLLAAQHNGVKPIWSSEIEKFPQAVTKHHFPDVIQLGDITMLDGATLPPVDIICAGSPCQDLSVAGKREGLKGERSGLFINAINIVRRMRWATNGRYPRFFVWENVPGAFSSGRDEFGNKCRGADFRAVLEEIGQAEVPIPADGRWAENGVAQLPGCEIAWRTLDAVAWVPQRRKRIFLIADFGPGRPCAKEILFVEKSMRGNFEKGQCQGEEVAGCVADGSGAPICLRMRGGREGGGKGALLSENRSLTLAANTNDQTVFQEQKGIGIDVYNGQITGKVACTLTSATGLQNASGPKVMNRMDQVVFSFDSLSSNSMKSSKQRGSGVYEVRSCTLTAVDRHAVACESMSTTGGQNSKAYAIGNGQVHQLYLQDNCGALNCMQDRMKVMQEVDGGNYKCLKNTNSAIGENATPQVHSGHTKVHMGGGSENIVSDKAQYAVRRLTPTECERLQGLPDNYTLIDDKSCSDSARYKALGNGMAQPCADFVIRRIVEEALGDGVSRTRH